MSSSLWPHVTVAHQAPLSMGFPRQENWSGLPFPSPEDLPDQGLNPCLLHWQADALPLSHLGSPSTSNVLSNELGTQATGRAEDAFLRNQQNHRRFGHTKYSILQRLNINCSFFCAYNLTFIIFLTVITLMYSRNRNGSLMEICDSHNCQYSRIRERANHTFLFELFPRTLIFCNKICFIYILGW